MRRRAVGGMALGLVVLAALWYGASQRKLGRVIEISHRRTACYGRCPVYSMTVRNDGTARLGGSTGVVPRKDFDRLVALADEARFFGLNPTYDNLIADAPECYTTITTDRKTKEVKTRCMRFDPPKYAEIDPGVRASYERDNPPPGLVSLEGALDALRQTVAWKADSARSQ